VIDPAGEFLNRLGEIGRLPETGQRQRSRRSINRGFHRFKATPQINESTAVGRRSVLNGGAGICFRRRIF
jgi:hypothetical protein